MFIHYPLLASLSLFVLIASSFASVVPVAATATATWHGLLNFTPTTVSPSTKSDIFPIPSAYAEEDVEGDAGGDANGGASSDSGHDDCTGACASSYVASSLSAASAPTSTGFCAAGCTRLQHKREYLWHSQQIAATITAATVIYVVDQDQQTISTKTVTNTELDLANITTPTDVNSAGTRTTKITAPALDGQDSTVVTLTFPSVFVQYGNEIILNGAVPITTGTTSSCSQVSANSTITLPSHPTVPIQPQRTHSVPTSSVGPDDLNSLNYAEYTALNERFALDPKGWTFENDLPELFNPTTDLYDHVLEPLFPDLAYMNCSLGGDVVVNEKPAVKANFAAALNANGPSLYVTHTTTSQATDIGSSKQQSQFPSTQPTKSSEEERQPTNTAGIVPSPSAAALPEQIAKAQFSSNSPGPLPDVRIQGSGSAIPPATPSAPDLVGAAAPSGSLLGETPSTQISTTPVGGPSSSNEDNSDSNTAGAVKPQATLTPDIAQNAPSSSIAVEPQVASTANIAQNAPASSTAVKPQAESTPDIVQNAPASSTPVIVAGQPQGTNTVASPPTNAGARPPATTALAPIILNDQTLSPGAGSGYVVAEQTIQPGSTIVLGSGVSATTVALQRASNGDVDVLVGPSSSQVLQIPRPTALAPVTFNGQTLSPITGTASRYIVAGQTLVPGSRIVLGSGASPTTIALQTASNGNLNIIVGSSSSEIPQLSMTTPFVTQLPPFTMGSQTISANDKGQYIIGSQTVTAGGVVTVSGTPVSIGSSATDVVVGSSTEALGPYIVGGLGAGPGAGPNATTSPLAFEGHGERIRASFGTCCAAVGVIIIMVMCA